MWLQMWLQMWLHHLLAQHADDGDVIARLAGVYQLVL